VPRPHGIGFLHRTRRWGVEWGHGTQNGNDNGSKCFVKCLEHALLRAFSAPQDSRTRGSRQPAEKLEPRRAMRNIQHSASCILAEWHTHVSHTADHRAANYKL
jgi:hypothetical protein